MLNCNSKWWQPKLEIYLNFESEILLHVLDDQNEEWQLDGKSSLRVGRACNVRHTAKRCIVLVTIRSLLLVTVHSQYYTPCRIIVLRTCSDTLLQIDYSGWGKQVECVSFAFFPLSSFPLQFYFPKPFSSSDLAALGRAVSFLVGSGAKLHLKTVYRHFWH